MKTVFINDGISVDWPDTCPACGDPHRHALWIAAQTRSCQPYPCACPDTKARAAELPWVVDPACWWRDRVSKTVKSRCPCWGRARDDRLPADCCSRDVRNPLYAPQSPGGLPDPSGTPESVSAADTARQAGITVADLEAVRVWEPVEVAGDGLTPVETGTPGDASTLVATPEGFLVDPDADDEPDEWEGGPQQAAPRLRKEPYKPRWSKAERDCVHTVADDIAFHCASCCTSWSSASAAQLHCVGGQLLAGRCRDPRTVVDVMTGVPLLASRMVGGVLAWGYAPR